MSEKKEVRVTITNPKHPHYGESGVLTGKVIQVVNKQMAEVKLGACAHGTDGCFITIKDARIL